MDNIFVRFSKVEKSADCMTPLSFSSLTKASFVWLSVIFVLHIAFLRARCVLKCFACEDAFSVSSSSVLIERQPKSAPELDAIADAIAVTKLQHKGVQTEEEVLEPPSSWNEHAPMQPTHDSSAACYSRRKPIGDGVGTGSHQTFFLLAPISEEGSCVDIE